MESKEEKKEEPKNQESYEYRPLLFRFFGVRFILKQLTKGELDKIMRLAAFDSLRNFNLEKGIEEFIIQILQSNFFGDIISIVLKVDNSTLWRRISNKYFIWKNKVELRTLVDRLELWEVKNILTGFFIINVGWMMSLIDTGFISNLTTMISSQMKTQETLRQMNLRIPLRKEDTQKEK